MPSATGYRAEEILDSSTSFYRVNISNLIPTKNVCLVLKKFGSRVGEIMYVPGPDPKIPAVPLPIQ